MPESRGFYSFSFKILHDYCCAIKYFRFGIVFLKNMLTKTHSTPFCRMLMLMNLSFFLIL